MPPELPEVFDPPFRHAAALSTDIDLYCLTCGYNLRGLSGDPRRCPECGRDNPVGELYMPAEFITRQLRAMESSAAGSVAAALMALASVAGGCIANLLGASQPIPIISTVFVSLWPIGLMWFGCAARFRASCLAKDGWSEALIRYHAVGVIAGTIVFVAALFALGPLSGHAPLALRLLAAAAVPVVILLTRKWLYAPLRACLDILQREVAVEIARTQLRRRLLRGPRKHALPHL